MARSFNGTSDDIVTTASGVSTTAFTLAGWVNPAALSGQQSIMCSDDVNTTRCTDWLLNFVNTTFYVFSGGSNSLLNGVANLSTNTWAHLAASYQFVTSGTSVMKSYVNGSLDNSLSNAVGPMNSPIPMWIGARNNGPDIFFGGRLADLAIWNAVLTLGEIAALARGARPYTIRPTSLNSWWPLDGLRSPEPDLSGNAKNGTLTGTAFAFGPPTTMFTPRWPMTTITPTPPTLTLMPQACL